MKDISEYLNDIYKGRIITIYSNDYFAKNFFIYYMAQISKHLNKRVNYICDHIDGNLLKTSFDDLTESIFFYTDIDNFFNENVICYDAFTIVNQSTYSLYNSNGQTNLYYKLLNFSRDHNHKILFVMNYRNNVILKPRSVGATSMPTQFILDSDSVWNLQKQDDYLTITSLKNRYGEEKDIIIPFTAPDKFIKKVKTIQLLG